MRVLLSPMPLASSRPCSLVSCRHARESNRRLIKGRSQKQRKGGSNHKLCLSLSPAPTTTTLDPFTRKQRRGGASDSVAVRSNSVALVGAASSASQGLWSNTVFKAMFIAWISAQFLKVRNAFLLSPLTLTGRN